MFTKQTVFIPVLDWNELSKTRMWMYTEEINPISMLIRLMRRNPNRVKQIFGDRDVVFLGSNNYFKINFSKTAINDGSITKFTYLIRKLIALKDTVEADPADEPMVDSPKAITMDIIDKLDKNQGIKINNMAFTGVPDTDKWAKEDNFVKKAPTDKQKGDDGKGTAILTGKERRKRDEAIKTTPEPKADKEKAVPKNQKEVDKDISDRQKQELVDNIIKAAGDSASSDEAIEKMDKNSKDHC